MIDADIAKNELKLEDTSHRLAEARDDEDTTDIRRKKQDRITSYNVCYTKLLRSAYQCTGTETGGLVYGPG